MILKAMGTAGGFKKQRHRLGLWGLSLSLIVGSGCRSIGLSNYVTPTISGRVLAGDTGRPLPGARVLRLQPGQSAGAGSPAKGAELLQQERPEITGADGSFVLAGRNYISFFNRSGRWSARVVFQAAGFVTLQTNYTSANIISNSAASEPQIDTGDILLKPLTP